VANVIEYGFYRGSNGLSIPAINPARKTCSYGPKSEPNLRFICYIKHWNILMPNLTFEDLNHQIQAHFTAGTYAEGLTLANS
jgi:hypothetical protein